MSLDLKIKKFKIVFSEKEGRESLPLTELKAEAVIRFLKDRSARYIDLTDDDGNYSETIAKVMIKGVTKIDDNGSKYKNHVWICSCGRRNPMHIWPASKCECRSGSGEVKEQRPVRVDTGAV